MLHCWKSFLGTLLSRAPIQLQDFHLQHDGVLLSCLSWHPCLIPCSAWRHGNEGFQDLWSRCLHDLDLEVWIVAFPLLSPLLCCVLICSVSKLFHEPRPRIKKTEERKTYSQLDWTPQTNNGDWVFQTYIMICTSTYILSEINYFQSRMKNNFTFYHKSAPR